MNVLKGILVALGILTFIAILPLHLWKEFELVENRTATFAVSDCPSLEILGGNGQIIITGVADLNEIVVDAQIMTWGNSEREARENLEMAQLIMEQRNGAITLAHNPSETGSVLRLRGQDGYGLEIGREDRVNFNVRVPSGTSLQIENHDGDVLIDNVMGAIRITTDDGDIVIRNGRGQLDVQSDDGNVDLIDFSGSLSITTSDGDIAITGGRFEGESTIRSEDGDVEVAFREDASLIISISIDDGELETDYPVEMEGPNQFTATLNDGAARLNITVNDDGDVNLRPWAP